MLKTYADNSDAHHSRVGLLRNQLRMFLSLVFRSFTNFDQLSIHIHVHVLLCQVDILTFCEGKSSVLEICVLVPTQLVRSSECKHRTQFLSFVSDHKYKRGRIIYSLCIINVSHEHLVLLA